MEEDMKESTREIRSMAKVYICILMGQNLKENGRMANKMELDFFMIRKDKTKEREDGKMEN
jgi:hypothetical protein